MVSVSRTGIAGYMGLGLARLSNFLRLWSIGFVPSSLVLVTGATRASDCGTEYENLLKKVAVGVDSGLVGLHLKGVLRGEFWLNLEGAIPPGSARPQDVQASEYRK